ncbi:hypothetical protein [Nesterenkonia pannonica]|uniref:hypothetical protein n=1 Tax=Nesterenkonia pannonica TaxID=1548602 RepID=UPI0021642E77|nr:hypothetical protein [Nesterenkonia pannonica]
MTILLTGFLTTMALIVAIGPQSAWLLRQGLRRDRVALAVTACLIGDIALIALGSPAWESRSTRPRGCSTSCAGWASPTSPGSP